MKQLKNHVAVITGAGNGIGRALALNLAQKGCDLALADISEAALEETAGAVGKFGRRVTTHLADVSDRERMAALPEEIKQAHNHIHLLINNAGVGVYKSIEEQPIEDMEWIMGINLWGVIYGCKFFLPYLKQEAEAHIVNVSSLLGIIGLAQQGTYSATKFAVRGLTESLWCELKGTGVHVSIVHPGAVKTNILNTARYEDAQTEIRLKKIADTFGPSPEKAARIIHKAISKGKRVSLVSPLNWLGRIILSCPPLANITSRIANWALARRIAD